jgi:hypothetical protein
LCPERRKRYGDIEFFVSFEKSEKGNAKVTKLF